MVYEKGYFSLKIKKLGNWFKNMVGLKYDKSGNFCYGGLGLGDDVLSLLTP